MKKAFTLLPVVFLVIMLIIVGTISALFLAGQSRIGVKKMYSTKALYIANAGYEYYVKQLSTDTDWSTPPAQPTKPFGGGVFIITTSNVSQSQITVTSQGLLTAEGISYSRKLTATLNKTDGGLSYILGKYVLCFGGAGGTGVNPLTTLVKENTIVTGDIFSNSNINFTNGDVVNGNAFSTGNISGTTSGITGTAESQVPQLSDPPRVDPAPYNAEIAIANAQTAGNVLYKNTILSGNYYVNGNVAMSGTINISGSANIVCTGTFSVGNNDILGNNLTVISGGAMTFGNHDVSVGNNCLFYSATTIVTGNMTSAGSQITAGTGTSFIAQGNVNLGNNNIIKGFIYSGETLTVGNNNNLSGNIIAKFVDSIGNNTILTLQGGLVGVAGISGVTGGTGVGGTGFREEVVYMPPETERVPELIDEFLEWLNGDRVKELNPVLLAGVAHYEIAWIHPFIDGNGRTARLLATLILYLKGFDHRQIFALDDYYDRDRKSYYAALATVDKETKNITQWLEYFTDGVAFSVNEIKEKILRLGLKGKKGTIAQIALSPRQMKIVSLINARGKISNRELQAEFKISSQAVHRELSKLVVLKVIKSQGESRSLCYILA